jgi:protein involved in ribonucleotide reduction
MKNLSRIMTSLAVIAIVLLMTMSCCSKRKLTKELTALRKENTEQTALLRKQSVQIDSLMVLPAKVDTVIQKVDVVRELVIDLTDTITKQNNMMYKTLLENQIEILKTRKNTDTIKGILRHGNPMFDDEF